MNNFKVKLTFEMLTVRGQQHSFSTHERVFLWKCQSFCDRKCLDLRGTRTPNLRIHAECSNLLSYQGQAFAVPCFEIRWTSHHNSENTAVNREWIRWKYHNKTTTEFSLWGAGARILWNNEANTLTAAAGFLHGIDYHMWSRRPCK